VTEPLLLDNSAWARMAHPSLDPARREEIADCFLERRFVICLPFVLEAGYSARNQREHAQFLDEISALAFATIDGRVDRRAIAAQQQLARVGHHRLPPADLIIAAIADRHGYGILHYDADFDLIRERTNLAFPSEWLAPRGSL
jgi:predicted nucleic acid-binding protein